MDGIFFRRGHMIWPSILVLMLLGACDENKEEVEVCKSGESRCGADGQLESCVNNGWESRFCDKGQFCVNGECKALKHECESGSNECTDKGLLKFCQDGQWKLRYCDAGFKCEEGECKEVIDCSVEGEQKCSDDGLVSRCEGGKWVKSYCDVGFKCEEGQCKSKGDSGCDEGMKRCSDSGILLRCVEGKEVGEYCGVGEVCEEGECKEIKQLQCTQGQSECIDSKNLRRCVNYRWEKTDCSVDGGYCDKGVCLRDLSCKKEGERVCDGNTLKYCKDGKYLSYQCEIFGKGKQCRRFGDFSDCVFPCSAAEVGKTVVKGCKEGSVVAEVCHSTSDGQYGYVEAYGQEVCTESGEIASCRNDDRLAYDGYGKCGNRVQINHFINLLVRRMGTKGEACSGDEQVCFDKDHRLVCEKGRWEKVACVGDQKCYDGVCQSSKGLVGDFCNEGSFRNRCEIEVAYRCQNGRVVSEDCSEKASYGYQCSSADGSAFCTKSCDKRYVGQVRDVFSFCENSYMGYNFYVSFCEQDDFGAYVQVHKFYKSICMDGVRLSCYNNKMKSEQCTNGCEINHSSRDSICR